MFDIGWPEMLVVAIVLIVVVGPKDLPAMLRNFGRTTSKLRSMAGDFRKQFDEALKEAELDDVKGVVDDVRKLNPAADIRKALSPMEKAAQDVRSGLDAAMKPKPQAQEDAAKGNVPAATKAMPAAPLKTGNDGPAATKPAQTAKKPAKSKTATKTTAKPAAKPKTAAAAKPKVAAPAKPAAKPKAPAKRARAKASGAAAKKGGKTN